MMKKFFKNIALLLLILMVVGEIVVRLTHAVSDIPQRTIDPHGIQKYFPNQQGYWKGGGHSWTINRMGWPGELPNSFENLIIVIGDSFIENFMNPNECHQSVFLKQNMSDYNFMEAARSGVSLIEAMEISKQLDSLKPVRTLIYVNDTDFYESIFEINPMSDITQLNLDKKTVQHGVMKAPFIKKVLYNWKLMYYFYNRFYTSFATNSGNNNENPEQNGDNDKYLKHKVEIERLISFMLAKYDIDDKILVFHPNSSQDIINKCKDSGFQVIVLDSDNDKSWTYEHDNHWTCYGHKKAAEQIASGLSSKLLTPR